MPDDPKHLLRPLRLFWARLGSLQIYFVVLFAIVLALAAFGLWHLIAPATPITPSAPGHPITNLPPAPAATTAATVAVAKVSPTAAAAAPSTPAPPTSASAFPRAIAITDVKETMRRGMRGETLVVAEIGMTPQTTADKEKVEIDVSFFDLDRDNQMLPTDAQITYEWLTPERDWTDPSPKYLAATYLQPRPFRRGPENLRYGGFIVRIYSDGKLQDERSKPETLIASLRANAPAPTPPSAILNSPSSTSSPVPPSSFRPPPSAPPPTLNSQPSDSPPSSLAPRSSPADSLPKGIVVPNKPGFVQSPYDPKFIIDVRGFPPGTLVNDPNTNKPFRVP